jgi:hypothetical protein
MSNCSPVIKGHRAMLVLLAGILLMGAVGSPKQSAKPEQSQELREATLALKEIAAAVKNAQSLDETKHPCDLKMPDRKSELCAQWKAADAANEATKWAARGFWVGLGGFIGLILTLHYTRKAVLAAEIATKDASQALAVAERNAEAAAKLAQTSQLTAENELRAYIGTLGAAIFDLSSQNPRVIIDIKNFGQTPARIVKTDFYVVHESNGNPKKKIQFNDSPPDQGLCEPGHSQSLTKIIFSDINIESDTILAELTITYLDFMGRKFWRRMSYRADVLSACLSDRLSMNVLESGNDEGEGAPPESQIYDRVMELQ